MSEQCKANQNHIGTAMRWLRKSAETAKGTDLLGGMSAIAAATQKRHGALQWPLQSSCMGRSSASATG